MEKVVDAVVGLRALGTYKTIGVADEIHPGTRNGIVVWKMPVSRVGFKKMV